MRTMLVLLGMSFGGFVLGQTNTTDGWLKDTANLSAVGALIAALAFLLKVYIPARDVASAEQQKAFTATLDKMADRHERTLLLMTKNCAEAQVAMRAEPKGPGS